MTNFDKRLISLIILLALVTCVIFIIPKQAEFLQVEISVEGNLYSLIELNQLEPYQLVELVGPLGISTVEIKEGKVRMLSSPCPDHICMGMGWMGNHGQTIACVPNRIIIKVISAKQSLDAIVR